MDLIAGIDEAGRGSFLGRVYSGCVIWDNNLSHKLLKDSKKLSKTQREFMRDFIIENAIAWSIGWCDNKHIDKYGIVNATMKSMNSSINNLNIQLDKVYVDGNYFKSENPDLKFECFVQGDSLHKCISAASILAKTFHDDHIADLCNKNPDLNLKYNLLKNNGYGTKSHIEGIKSFGISEFHRKSFLSNYLG